MKEYAFIWDLDGTLLDSYGVIVESLKKTFAEVNVEVERRDVLEIVKKESCSAFISQMEEKTGIAFDVLKNRYSEISGEEKKKITLISHAKDILDILVKNGCRNYVFTHRGSSTRKVLENLSLIDYFEEIITGIDGFPRKPDGTAIEYLIQKYNLDKEKTFYVGDRTIDMECAQNSEIQGILYLEQGSVVTPSGNETFVISDLLDIVNVLS